MTQLMLNSTAIRYKLSQAGVLLWPSENSRSTTFLGQSFPWVLLCLLHEVPAHRPNIPMTQLEVPELSTGKHFPHRYHGRLWYLLPTEKAQTRRALSVCTPFPPPPHLSLRGSRNCLLSSASREAPKGWGGGVSLSLHIEIQLSTPVHASAECM